MPKTRASNMPPLRFGKGTRPRNAGGFLHNLPDVAPFGVVRDAPAPARRAPKVYGGRTPTGERREYIACSVCKVRGTWVPEGTVEAYECPRCVFVKAQTAPTKEPTIDPIQAARARHRAKMQAAKTGARRGKRP